MLLASRGSPHSTTAKTAGFYLEGLRNAGWKAEWCADKHGTPVEDAVDSLRSQGVDKTIVIPLYVAFEGPSSERIRERIESTGMDARFEKPVAGLPVFKEILDSKVPEGWRRSQTESDFAKADLTSSTVLPGTRLIASPIESPLARIPSTVRA